MEKLRVIDGKYTTVLIYDYLYLNTKKELINALKAYIKLNEHTNNK